MKVDELSVQMRVAAMLDWYQHSEAYKIPTTLIHTYYGTDDEQLKQSIQKLYDKYCESLEEAFGIKRSVVDLSEYFNEKIAALNMRINQPLWDFIEDITEDPNTIESNTDSSLCNWEKFIRAISKIDILSMIAMCAMLSQFEESITSIDFDTFLSNVPRSCISLVHIYTSRETLYTRISDLISTLNMYKTAYEKKGVDGILEKIGETSKSENLSDCDLEKLESCNKEELKSAIPSIQEPDHYQSLLKEECLDPKLDPQRVFVQGSNDQIAQLERYYEIVDEIYHDIYRIESAWWE